MFSEYPRLRAHRRSVVAIVVAAGMLLVLALGGFLAAWSWQSKLDRNIERIPSLVMRPDVEAPPATAADGQSSVPPAAAPSDDRAVNFLLLGTDSRISAGDPTMWELGAQRTDAIMLVQLAAHREALTVMSIPRDSWVEIPGHGTHKINAAFSFGGPALTVQTIEALTGVVIDHVAIADFESFATLTDELGGVDITLQQPLTVDGVELAP
ncbi:MAG TPA: LCP family protein, partial [Brevibacterium sp.]|nr:LCP family protein [Brevibacterium sp.]